MLRLTVHVARPMTASGRTHSTCLSSVCLCGESGWVSSSRCVSGIDRSPRPESRNTSLDFPFLSPPSHPPTVLPTYPPTFPSTQPRTHPLTHPSIPCCLCLLHFAPVAASFKTLSALLSSSSVNVMSVDDASSVDERGMDDDDGNNDNVNGTVNGTVNGSISANASGNATNVKGVGLSSHGSQGASFFLKQEFIDEPAPRDEQTNAQDSASASARPWAGAGGGSSSGGGGGGSRANNGDASHQQVPYALLPSGGKKAFPLSAEGEVAEAEAASAAAVAATAAVLALPGASGMSERKGRPGALLAAQNAAYSAKAAAAEKRGFIGDQDKRDRFNEFISGFLSMSLFQAADVWLPLAGGRGGGGDSGGGVGGAGGATGGGSSNGKISRLFLFSSNIQVGGESICIACEKLVERGVRKKLYFLSSMRSTCLFARSVPCSAVFCCCRRRRRRHRRRQSWGGLSRRKGRSNGRSRLGEGWQEPG